jgi:hypothetical protein
METAFVREAPAMKSLVVAAALVLAFGIGYGQAKSPVKLLEETQALRLAAKWGFTPTQMRQVHDLALQVIKRQKQLVTDRDAETAKAVEDMVEAQKLLLGGKPLTVELAEKLSGLDGRLDRLQQACDADVSALVRKAAALLRPEQETRLFETPHRRKAAEDALQALREAPADKWDQVASKYLPYVQKPNAISITMENGKVTQSEGMEEGGETPKFDESGRIQLDTTNLMQKRRENAMLELRRLKELSERNPEQAIRELVDMGQIPDPSEQEQQGMPMILGGGGEAFGQLPRLPMLNFPGSRKQRIEQEMKKLLTNPSTPDVLKKLLKV